MTYEAQQIAERLHAARVARGMSQRALSSLAGVPQAQISRIEAGTVDLRLSSLAALAHALDLELALVPRKAMPAVQSLTREALPKKQQSIAAIQREMQSISKTMKHLQINVPKLEGLDALQKSFADLQRFRSQGVEPEALRQLRQSIEQINRPARQISAMAKSQDIMRSLRNKAAHSKPTEDGTEETRPAYTLDEDDDA